MSRRLVLCVDDELLILLALKHALRRELGPDIEVETAAGGEAALELLTELEREDREIAAVVSDWLMPGMGGEEFLRKLRARRPGLRLILLTGYADQAAVAALGREVGLAAVLQKPCRIDLLAAAVRGEA
jgi:CheY-like chemotaxis protein